MLRRVLSLLPVLFMVLLLALAAQGQKDSGTGNSRPQQPPPQFNRPIVIHGMVRMEDGTPVSRRVTIERVCAGSPIREAYTDSSGGFSFQAGQNLTMIQEASLDSAMAPNVPGPPAESNQTSNNGSAVQSGTGPWGNPGGSYTSPNPGVGPSISPETLMLCDIRASLPGYRSDVVELADKVSSHEVMIDVGTIVLHPLVKTDGTVVSVTSLKAPKAAKKAVESGRKNGQKEKYPEALADFQKAVQIDPNYAEAWYYLAETQIHLHHNAEAEQDFQKAIDADEHFVPPLMGLAQLLVGRTAWEPLAAVTEKLIALDPYTYPMAYLYNSAANWNLRRDDLAQRSAERLEKLDTQHKLPKINLLMAEIRVVRKEYPAAAEELRTFLKYSPPGKEADMARNQLEQIEKASGQAQAQPAQPQK